MKKSRARIDFTIWVNGKKVQVGAQVGTMVTIASGGRVIGLSPTESSAKRISVALLELKSDKDSVAKVSRSAASTCPLGESPHSLPLKK